MQQVSFKWTKILYLLKKLEYVYSESTHIQAKKKKIGLKEKEEAFCLAMAVTKQSGHRKTKD